MLNTRFQRKGNQMSTRHKRSARKVASEISASRLIIQTPALERAIDRLFPPDVLANLGDPDRPALERLDDVDTHDLRSTLSC